MFLNVKKAQLYIILEIKKISVFAMIVLNIKKKLSIKCHEYRYIYLKYSNTPNYFQTRVGKT